jgi:hypothetical protein
MEHGNTGLQLICQARNQGWVQHIALCETTFTKESDVRRVDVGVNAHVLATHAFDANTAATTTTPTYQRQGCSVVDGSVKLNAEGE